MSNHENFNIFPKISIESSKTHGVDKRGGQVDDNPVHAAGAVVGY